MTLKDIGINERMKCIVMDGCVLYIIKRPTMMCTAISKKTNTKTNKQKQEEQCSEISSNETFATYRILKAAHNIDRLID